MDEQKLLNDFKVVFKVCGLRKLVGMASASKVADYEGLAFDPDTFVSSLAHDCVEVVRTSIHPLAKLAAKTKLERSIEYEHEGCQVAMNMPYGASSILTELYKKLMGLIIADKTGRLTLESAKEGLKDLTVWGELLWDYLAEDGYEGVATEKGDYESNKQVKSSRGDSEHKP